MSNALSAGEKNFSSHQLFALMKIWPSLRLGIPDFVTEDLVRWTFAIFVLLISLTTWLIAEENPMADPSMASVQPAWMMASITRVENDLVAKYGEQQRQRAQRGLHQVSEFWRAEDGDGHVFEDFVTANFAGDQATLDTMFNRLERLLEQLDGHMHEINREFRQQMDLDLGPVLPFDEIIGGYDPSAHVTEDFFQNKLAFAVLL